eukprot:GHVU01134979.1.p3 GENE.GHVU01134979.1~~GHVU01134979.1.p3  ORF type:complete len:142 (+),score=14.43 GHVU01134979.1:1-426(+)
MQTIMASVAKALGSRICSGMRTKPAGCFRELGRSSSRTTARLDWVVSATTVQASLNAAHGLRMCTGNGRKPAVRRGMARASSVPSRMCPALSERLSSSHSTSSAMESTGVGKRAWMMRFMACFLATGLRARPRGWERAGQT